MSDIQRKLASIREITEIRPIPDADSIECAYVGGWPVVVKRGEFNPGDLAVYFEIDSWIPHDLAPFLSKGKEPREYNGVKGERLRTLKLRGQVSQGLLLPVYPMNDGCGAVLPNGAEVSAVEGENLTEILGIQKWEAPIPACLAGQVRGNFPSFIPKTDQERCQNIVSEIFETHKGESYEVTLKLDGSSCTVYAKDGDIGVCSRNLDLEETEGNSFWQAARKQLLIEALTKFQTVGIGNFALQMELIGEGIQGNQEKIKGHRLYLFDVYNIDEQTYLNPVERQRLLDSLLDAGADLEHAPVLDPSLCVTDCFDSVEKLLAFADGPSLNPAAKREGLVFKSNDSRFSFKAISNKWLLKNS
jgi:RNA ligase (TIGR02306 family)